jgi:peptidoglycan hydrolase CwlO-like protein
MGLVLGTVLAISNSAQAANFTTNVDQKDGAEGDIILKSVIQKDVNGKEVKNERFSLVDRAVIRSNTPITDLQVGDTSNPEATGRNNNTGGASTDKGDRATAPMNVSGMKDPTGKEIATFLGNKNLSNIIDSEDAGSYVLDLFFNGGIRADKTGLDNLYIWERGMNSNMTIYGLDSQGKQVGNAVRLFATTPKDLADPLNLLKSEEKTLTNNVKDLQSSADNLQKDVNTLSGKIKTLSSDTNILSATITTLKSDVSSLSGNITTLNGDINSLPGNITTLNGEISKLNDDIITLNGDISKLNNDIKAIKPLPGNNNKLTASQQTTLNSKKTELSGKQTTLNSKKTELSGKQTTLNSKKTELSSKQDLLTKQQNDLKNRLTELSTKETTLTSKQTELNNNRNNLTDKQTALTRNLTELNSKKTELTKKQTEVTKAQQRVSNITQASAGYTIDTMEISAAQNVGSWGVNLSQFGANITYLAGIRVDVSGARGDNGPDFKMMARVVPEPGTVMALGLFTAGAVGNLRRRRRFNQA